MNDTATVDSLIAGARDRVKAGDIAEAMRLCERVLALDPNHAEALGFVGQRALADGQFAQAQNLLERAVESEPGDVQVLKSLGLACMGAGRFDEARFAFDRALLLQPDFFIARLYLGRVLQELGHDDAALREYFTAILAAQAQGRWLGPDTTPPQLRELVTGAMRFVNVGRRRVLGAPLDALRAKHGPAALARADQALAIYLGDAPASYPDPLQRPKVLFYPGLPTTRYFARDLFDWYARLEASTAVIREELLAVLASQDAFRPFLDLPSAEDVPKFLGAGPQGPPAWDAFFFYRHGVRYEDNCARCPNTAAILETLPIPRIRAHAPEICFSVLAPGTHILPHHGVTNTRLVTHLPLIVPDRCAIRVGGEEHAWQEGRCVTFDDTFEHEAWNRSDQTRVVLILDCWNPHLTAVEREAVAAMVETIGDFNRECGIPG